MDTVTRRGPAKHCLPRDTPEHFAPDTTPDPVWDPEAQARSGPVFRAAAHHSDLSLAEVMRAVPEGSRRARDQVQALRAGLACPDLEDVTPKLRAKLEQWWRIHVLHASWGGEGKAPRGVTSPGRARVCDLIRDPKSGKPASVTSYKRYRRWWQQRGYIGIVREGWTPDLSPGVLHGPDRDHNLSQAYVLTIPRRPGLRAMRQRRRPAQTKNGPLSCFSQESESLTRAREANPEKPSVASCCYSGADARHEKTKNQTRRTKGSLEGGVRLHVGALARVGDGWWSHVTRPFRDWSPRDLLFAIDHTPDGRAHLGTADQVRNPVAWLRWRLSHWLRPDGTALPSAAEAAAERARRHRELQALEHAGLGITERAARIRAAHGTTPEEPVPDRPWAPPAGARRQERPLVGWAARSAAPEPRSAPAQPVRDWRTDPEWLAVVAAAAAAVEAEDADRA